MTLLPRAHTSVAQTASVSQLKENYRRLLSRAQEDRAEVSEAFRKAGVVGPPIVHPFHLQNDWRAFNFSGFPGGVFEGCFGKQNYMLQFGIQVHFPDKSTKTCFRSFPEINWRLLSRKGHIRVEDVRGDLRGDGTLSTFAAALISMLQTGYIYAHVNRYFISGTLGFSRWDDRHDVLMIGLDASTAEVFVVVGFDQFGRYEVKRVPFSLMALSLSSAGGWDENRALASYNESERACGTWRQPVYHIVPKMLQESGLNCGMVFSQIGDYLAGTWTSERLLDDSWKAVVTPSRENGVFGLASYDLFADHIHERISIGTMNLRPTRALAEHKRQMTARLAMLQRQGVDVPERVLSVYRSLSLKCQAIHVACCSWFIRGSRQSGLMSWIADLPELQRSERSALEELIERNPSASRHE